MPERMKLRRADKEEPSERRKLTESEARRLWFLRIGIAFIALVVLIWLIVFIAGRIGTVRAAGPVYQALQQEVTGQGIEADIRAFGATLSPRQVRALTAGRSLPYSSLTAEQQGLFSSIDPLPEPDAPAATPYRVRLQPTGDGRRELQLVWTVRGTGEAVVKGVAL